MASEKFTVQRGTATLAGERWAGDGQPVVLLHAGVADRRSWHAVAEALQPAKGVVAYDMRGYGETSGATYGFTHLDDPVSYTHLRNCATTRTGERCCCSAGRLWLIRAVNTGWSNSSAQASRINHGTTAANTWFDVRVSRIAPTTAPTMLIGARKLSLIHI